MQGQWNVRSCRLPGVSKIVSWCLVVLMPQDQADVEGPSGVVPFMQDLVTSLNSTGVECAMPPIVYEQVWWFRGGCGCKLKMVGCVQLALMCERLTGVCLCMSNQAFQECGQLGLLVVGWAKLHDCWWTGRVIHPRNQVCYMLLAWSQHKSGRMGLA